jgi:hypothetical protein
MEQQELKLGESSKFYEFRQNNTGGRFYYSDTLGETVVVEAYSPGDANTRFEAIGGYFNGCSDGSDCSCCGDRWYPQWDDDKGDSINEIIEAHKPRPDAEYSYQREGRQLVVHYLDGRVEWHNRELRFGSRSGKKNGFE